jgi:uncharacterized protein
MYARPFIDSLEFAENGQQIDTAVPVAHFTRLHDALDNPTGIVHYRVLGGKDRLGRSVLDISLSGECQLRCQRCMQALDYVIQQETRLLLCDEAGLDELEDEEDGILAEATLDVLALIEDEILLNLPISPMHDKCQLTTESANNKDVTHPFAALVKLKQI